MVASQDSILLLFFAYNFYVFIFCFSIVVSSVPSSVSLYHRLQFPYNVVGLLTPTTLSLGVLIYLGSFVSKFQTHLLMFSRPQPFPSLGLHIHSESLHIILQSVHYKDFPHFYVQLLQLFFLSASLRCPHSDLQVTLLMNLHLLWCCFHSLLFRPFFYCICNILFR